MKKCCFCKISQPITDFLIREDRYNQRYAACKSCMTEQVRGPSWPKMEERGGGMLDSWIWKGTYVL